MKRTLVHSGSSTSLASVSSSPSFSPSFKDGPSESKLQASKSGFFARSFNRKNLERTLPILKWGPKYTKQKAVADLIAGLTVGLTILPQGLAYATVAGLPPIYGLYSSFVGCFVYIFFGSTKAITIGPTAIQCVLTNKYTSGRSPQYAVFLSFVTAVVTLFMGIFRLGFIANFISSPVNSGFTSGVALTIVATQIKALLGLKFHGEGFLVTAIGLVEHISETKKWDAILSLCCCVVLLSLKKLDLIFGCIRGKSVVLDKTLWLISTARSIIVIVVATGLVAGMGWDDNKPFSLVGNITAGLPPFRPPPFSIYEPADNRTHSITDILSEEASGLLVLPLLGIMGHMTIAKAFSGTERVDATQEITCIGISNAISCFFSSMPIGGSFSRTTVNAMAGVETPLGGLYTGIIVLMALQFLTPYFYFIPKASLASVIVCCVIFMVDLSIIMPMWRSKKMDMFPWAATFLVTIFAGLEYGILTGFLISTSFLLYYAARPRVKIMKGETSTGIEFMLVDLDRSLTFPSVDYITYEITKTAKRWGTSKTPIVIDCHHIQFADYTAAEAMRNMITSLYALGYSLVFFKLKPSVEKIVNGIMVNSKTPLILCHSTEDLEELLNKGIRRYSDVFQVLSSPKDMEIS
ncbi:unnamed protein product [Allacma fusca]|uniref:STAS domain-containing protein n=1 Tax=Allacma fusca TaxID=39272 RepID=A0A8J2NH87_9HEXA|nr:unnamed protein product [Allacma fusca]